MRSLIVLLMAETLFAANQDKMPLPTAEDRAEARTTIEVTFGPAVTVAKLLSVAGSDKVIAGSAAHWALLETAGMQAVRNGDVDQAAEAAKLLGETFCTDFGEVHLVWVQELCKVVREPSSRDKLALWAMDIAEAAAQEDEFARAGKAKQLAMNLARRGRNAALAKQLAARNHAIEERQGRFVAFQRAQIALDNNPVDPTANRIVGLYHCEVQGDWERGVPMLALCDKPVLSTAAIQDLQAGEDPEEWVAVGDAWWDLAYRDRARMWYKRAAADPSIMGLLALKLQERLGAAPTRTAAPPAPLSRPKQIMQIEQVLPAWIWRVRWSDGGDQQILFTRRGAIQRIPGGSEEPLTVGRWEVENADGKARIVGKWNVAKVDLQVEGAGIRITRTHPTSPAHNRQGIGVPHKPVGCVD